MKQDMNEKKKCHFYNKECVSFLFQFKLSCWNQYCSNSMPVSWC